MNKLRTAMGGLGVAIVLLFTAVSCDSDDGVSANSETVEFNAFNAINARAQNTALYQAIVAASGGLDATLSGAGPFTVFAPNDTAFENLAGALGFSSARDMISGENAVGPDVLETILRYHVTDTSTLASELSDGQEVTTVLGETFTVSVTDGGVFLLDQTERDETSTSAQVVETDVIVTNGVIHTIDKVLLPQAIIDAVMIDTRPTITELAVATESLSILEAAVIKAGLADLLSGKNLDDDDNELGYTVFAPTDDAFVALLDFLGDDYNSLDDFDNDIEMALLSTILTYHVLPTRIQASDLEAGEQPTAAEGNSLDIVSSGNTFILRDAAGNDVNITGTDIDGSNGVVHTIDQVLLPQAALDFINNTLNAPDLAAVASSENDLSILVDALVKTELVDLFVDATNPSFVQEEGEGDDDFQERRTPANFTYYNTATVLAPTNAAFVELLNLLGDDYNSLDDFDSEEEIALLKNILLYHVVSGTVKSESVVPGTIIDTQIDDTIEVIEELGSDNVLLQDASSNSDTRLLTVDIEARNGVAHIINSVLLPEEALDFIDALNAPEEEE